MFPYQFKEFITKLEGNERTRIPEAAKNKLLQICLQHGYEPQQDPTPITYNLVQGFLRQSGYPHLFENTVQIIGLLTERQTPSFTSEQKEELLFYFRSIQEPFNRHKPAKRKNFLAYSFVTFKLCELLGHTQFFYFLPLLKADDNRIQADRVWAKICRDLKYQFIPTDPQKEMTMMPWFQPEAEGGGTQEK